jgi:YHS domain-containing protein
MESLVYFLLWGALIFLMMRFGCGAHVTGHGRGHGTSREEASWTPPEKDVDPVCGMNVQTATAKSSVHDRHVYFFCSADKLSIFTPMEASLSWAISWSISLGTG